jgi:hypothetical protein
VEKLAYIGNDDVSGNVDRRDWIMPFASKEEDKCNPVASFDFTEISQAIDSDA